MDAVTNEAKQAYLREARRFKDAAAEDAARLKAAETALADERSAR